VPTSYFSKHCKSARAGVKQDYLKHLFYTKSAEKGNASAQNSLGDYYCGEEEEQDNEKAVYLLKKNI
jgi:TPR repeat protein